MKQKEYRDSPRVVNMRAKEASQYVGCGLSTIWLWVKQRKIRAYKLSERVTIFKKEELDTFINANIKLES